MKTRRGLFISLAVLLLVACSCPLIAQTAAPTQAPLPTAPASATATATATQLALTEIPTASPTATLTPTPSVPQVTSPSVNVNCRAGPDVGYEAVSVLMVGQVAQIAGRNEDSSWWYIRDPGSSSGFCWVSASVVTAAGNLAGVPFIAPPAAIVTNVTVDVALPSTVYCGGPNAMDFSGTITTNGPTKVDFQWEVGGDASNTTSPESLNFAKAGTKDVPGPGAYKADCGSYSITLHVLSPNDASATRNFKIEP